MVSLLFVFAVICIASTNGEPSMEDIKTVWSRYTKVSDGDARYYGQYREDLPMACQLSPSPPIHNAPGWIKVAASRDDFIKSVGCGMCIEITGDGTPLTPATVGKPVKGTLKATIFDICGGCDQAGFDLYIPAGAGGVYKTKFKAVECPSLSGPEGNIQFRSRGSNAWYLKIQVRNAKVVTVGLEVLNNNKWVCGRRGGNNHFLINNLGEIKFPIKVRLTSISNEQLETTIEKLENDVDIPTKIQFSGFKADSKPEDIKCYGQGGLTQEANVTPEEGPNNATTTEPVSGENKPAPEKVPTTTAPAASTSQPEGAGTPKAPPTSTSQPGGTSTPKALPASTSQPGGTSNPNASPTPTTKPSGHTPSTAQDFCVGKADGQYPDKNNPAGFIMCDHDTTYKKKCPPGLMYNKNIKVCDWPRNVLGLSDFVRTEEHVL